MWRLLEIPSCGAAVEFGCSFGGSMADAGVGSLEGIGYCIRVVCFSFTSSDKRED